MVVSGLVKGLAWQELVDGLIINVGQTSFLLILLHFSHQEASIVL